MPTYDTQSVLSELREFIEKYQPLVLTGAGISTASGIPDYRDVNGVRRGRAPMMFHEFINLPEARKRYWARSMVGWPRVRDALPCAAHIALAALGADQRISGVITQNVDALHDKAGSHGTIELHGNLHRVVCLDCGKSLKREDVQVELEERNPDIQHTGAVFAPDGDAAIDDGHLDAFRLAGCPCCGSEKLKPDVVFFGEGVPNQIAQAAWAKVRNAKALMVVGSSLMAYSSFRLCKLTVEHGKPLVAINLGKTRADAILNMKIEQHSEDILPRLAAKFGSNN